MTQEHHSVEQLALLQQYLILFTIIFAIPGVSLLLNKDFRFNIAFLLYLVIVSIFIILYYNGNKSFFPDVTITQK
jgi:hypothetical protein